MSCDRLELIGLHCRLGDVNPETIEDTVWAMIAQMAWVRREYGLILARVACASSSRLSGATIATTCVPRHTDALEEAVEDAWPRSRHRSR